MARTLSSMLLACACACAAACGGPTPPRLALDDVTDITRAAVAGQLFLERLPPCDAFEAEVRRGRISLVDLAEVEPAAAPRCAQRRFEPCCDRHTASLALRDSRGEATPLSGALPPPFRRRDGMSSCEWDAWLGRVPRDVGVVGAAVEDGFEVRWFCNPYVRRRVVDPGSEAEPGAAAPHDAGARPDDAPPEAP